MEPVAAQERINSVDVIRGVAVLGILLMNIISFGLPGPAYGDPTVAGGATGWNLTSWLVNQIWFEGKMRAVFSMLFGAGVIIFTSRAAERGEEAEGLDLFLRRTLWLALFGLIHAYFIWIGDILFPYGLCGLLLLPFRKLQGRTLVLSGLFVLSLLVPKYYSESVGLSEMRDKATRADAAERSGQKLTEEQKGDQDDWKKKLKEFKPAAEDIKKEIADYRGSYEAVFLRRAKDIIGFHTVYFYRFIVFDVTGMMLIGMGLMKLGLFSASLPRSAYVAMAVAGYGIGAPLNCWIGLRHIASGWDPIAVNANFSAYDAGRLLVAMGHIGLTMLVCQFGLRFITAPLAAVGQMALSNYLLTSLLCTTYFYGYGLGRFAMLERYQLLAVVLAVWTINITLSPVWLRYFRFGPAEWLWRSLTRWERQPMRIHSQTEQAANATA